MDNSFDFNQFLIPLAKSKICFNLSENNKEELFYIIDLKPFGILKVPLRRRCPRVAEALAQALGGGQGVNPFSRSRPFPPSRLKIKYCLSQMEPHTR